MMNVCCCLSGHLQAQRVRGERTNSQGTGVTRPSVLSLALFSVRVLWRNFTLVLRRRCYDVGRRNELTSAFVLYSRLCISGPSTIASHGLSASK